MAVLSTIVVSLSCSLVCAYPHSLCFRAFWTNKDR